MQLINLPNIITCCNFLCGCFAVYFGFNDQMFFACLSILGGAFFDYFDGMTARAMHIFGPIGKELDSLADVVSFGFAPSVLAYNILRTYCAEGSWVPFLCFLMAAFSALRLAKFNCDERQTLSFIGLPTPANAMFWVGLSYVNAYPFMHDALNPVVYLIIMAICCWLLICEIPMFSMKIKPGHNGFSENKARYIFLGCTAVILIGSALISGHAFCCSPALMMLVYLILCILDSYVFRRNK